MTDLMAVIDEGMEEGERRVIEDSERVIEVLKTRFSRVEGLIYHKAIVKADCSECGSSRGIEEVLHLAGARTITCSECENRMEVE